MTAGNGRVIKKGDKKGCGEDEISGSGRRVRLREGRKDGSGGGRVGFGDGAEGTCGRVAGRMRHG